MRSEGELIEEELRQIRMQYAVMLDIKLSQYVLTPKFKTQFVLLPKTICRECGEEFRITHWCDAAEEQMWISNWEELIREVDESKIKKLREEQEKAQRESKLKIELKTEKLRQKLEDPSQKKTKTSNPNMIRNKDQMLPFDSVAQLSLEQQNTYEKLRLWRNSQARYERTQPELIANNTVLRAITRLKVLNMSELMRISGFSEDKANKYGSAIFRIINTTVREPSSSIYQMKGTNGKKFESSSRNVNGIIAFCCIALVFFVIILFATL
jgi:hypothetical protein